MCMCIYIYIYIYIYINYGDIFNNDNNTWSQQ